MNQNLSTFPAVPSAKRDALIKAINRRLGRDNQKLVVVRGRDLAFRIIDTISDVVVAELEGSKDLRNLANEIGLNN
jgi:hypothetical protein